MALWDHGLRVVSEPEAELIHLESQSTTDHYKMFLLERHRWFASAWSAELADREPRPVTDKPAAVQRAIRRRAERARPAVAEGHRHRRAEPGPTDRAGRELAASLAQIEVLNGPTSGASPATSRPLRPSSNAASAGVTGPGGQPRRHSQWFRSGHGSRSGPGAWLVRP